MLRAIRSHPASSVLCIYALCRGVTLAAICLVGSPVSIQGRIDAFDAGYYAEIAKHGYPHTLTPGLDTSISFFPGYPLLVRGVAIVTRLPVWGAQMVLSLVAGAIATLLIVRVISSVTDGSRGWHTGIAWQALPLAVLLCIGYSEAMFTAVAAVSLLYVLRRRWWAAGVAAALSSLIHSTGLVFVLVGLVALWHEYRQDHSWGPLRLVLLAPLGTLAYFAYLWRRTGHLTAWLTVEHSRANNAAPRFDLGKAAVKFVGKSILEPFAHPWFDVVTIVIGVSILLFVIIVLMPLPATLLAYSGGVLFLALTSGIATVGSFPRLTYVAFPIVTPIGVWVSKLPLIGRWVLLALGVALGCVLGIVITTTHNVTP